MNFKYIYIWNCTRNIFKKNIVYKSDGILFKVSVSYYSFTAFCKARCKIEYLSTTFSFFFFRFVYTRIHNTYMLNILTLEKINKIYSTIPPISNNSVVDNLFYLSVRSGKKVVHIGIYVRRYLSKRSILKYNRIF